MNIARSRRWSGFGRIICLVLAGTMLSGCIIVPVRPYHHGYYYR